MSEPLDQAWKRIEALRLKPRMFNNNATFDSWNDAIDQALAVITDLGGMDPELRQRPLDPPPGMRVKGGMSDE